MFNNFIKLSTGRTNIKIIAALLVITLTFANFALLGSYIGESYALDARNNATDVDNVKFEAFLDKDDKTKKQITADINAEDLKLYVSVNVQNEGRLEKAKIEFKDSNFELKDKTGQYEQSIGTIGVGSEEIFEIPIVARKDARFKLDLLNMESKVTLTGEYIDDKGNVTSVNSNKTIKIEWNANSISEEQIGITQELITNKIYNVEGINKRIIQIKVKTNIEGNKAPVKLEQIEIELPQVKNKPEQVTVIGDTLLTNGKTNIEFGKEEYSTYKYNKEEGKVYIDVINNADDTGAVSWAKNAIDEFIVTAIYSENVEILPLESNAKLNLELYGKEEAIKTENKLLLEKVEIMGEVATFNNRVQKEIYKGYMYVGKDTDYVSGYDLYLSYAEVAEKIIVQDLGEVIDSDNLASYYKRTQINKKQALKLLGNEGIIKIYNSDDLNTPIQEIKLSEEIEGEYYEVNYEGNVNKITVETTKPVTEGKLQLLNEKILKVTDTNKSIEATKLETTARLVIMSAQNDIALNIEKTENIDLKEPQTDAQIVLDKTSISNQVEDTLTLTAILSSTDAKHKLYKNPTLNIELPKEITNVSIEEDSVQLLYADDELNVKSSEIITNEAGNKVLIIELEGEQTKYTENVSAGGPNIIATLKIQSEEFMANKNVEIKTTFINDGEVAEESNKILIIAKNGIITKNSITIGEKVVEKINQDEISIKADLATNIATIQNRLINNNEKNIKDVVLVGNLKTNLLDKIETNLENAQIYYSEDLENWNQEIEDYSNVKAFKIIANNEVLNGEEIQVNYNLNLTPEVNKEEILSTLELNYVLGEQSLSKKTTYKIIKEESIVTAATEEVEQKYSAEIGLKPITTTGVLHQNQIVTYEVSVKNTGDTVINNAKLEYVRPEGTAFAGISNKGGVEIVVSTSTYNEMVWEIQMLNPGETITKEVTIKIENGTNKIVNNVRLINENNEIAVELTTKEIEVKNAKLKVVFCERGSVVDIKNEGDVVDYLVEIENITSEDLNNIIVEFKLQENASYAETDFNSEWSYNKEKNTMYYNISKLKGNETRVLVVSNKIDKIIYDDASEIKNNVIVKTEDNEEYESNTYIVNAEKTQMQIALTTDNSEQLKENEKVKYKITVKNTGKISNSINIVDEMPKEIEIENAKVYLNEELLYDINKFDNNVFSLYEYLESGDTLEAEIEGITKELADNVEKVYITNYAKLLIKNELFLESNKINHVIINEDWKPTPDPTPDPTPNPNKPLSISGLAWMDENKNGVRENNENILKDVNVILLDGEGNIAKDNNGNIIQTQTTLTGTYKFNNLEKGNYAVVFVYDTSKYEVTKYRVSNSSEENNCDAIEKIINLDNTETKVAITDIIKLEKEDAKNIDIGLITNSKFDLSLEKYIEKIVITNASGTTTYTFNTDATLAKVEIPAKYINNSTIIVEYGLVVTNEGQVNGYVEDLMDYMPKDLSFNSELNPDWYVDQSGNLHNNTLAKTAIKPGETSKVKLVLTKTNSTTGTIINNAEIGLSTNLEGLTEYDSVVGNNKPIEDDYGKAELIVSIVTGSVPMYIGIVIGSLAILGIGIYLINKKVLKGGI